MSTALVMNNVSPSKNLIFKNYFVKTITECIMGRLSVL